MHSVTNKNHVVFEVRNVRVWYGHTMTFIPSTAVATRKTTALHHQNPRRSERETQSRDLTCEGWKRQMLKSLTSTTWLWQKTRGAGGRVWFVQCGCFHHPLGCPPGSSRRFQLCQKPSWNYSFHPIETTTKKMGVFVVLPAQGFPPCYPLFLLTSFGNLYCQMKFGLLLYQQSVSFTFAQFFSLPECICSRNWRDGWYSAWSPSPSLIWASQLCNSSFVCLLINIWFLYPWSFSQRSTQPSKTSFVWWLGRRLLSWCIVGHGRASLPTVSDLLVCHALASSDMFDNSKLYEWLNDLGALWILLLEHSSHVRLSIRQASFQICKKLFLIGFFWCNTDIGHRLRCTCFLW